MVFSLIDFWLFAFDSALHDAGHCWEVRFDNMMIEMVRVWNRDWGMSCLASLGSYLSNFVTKDVRWQRCKSLYLHSLSSDRSPAAGIRSDYQIMIR